MRALGVGGAALAAALTLAGCGSGTNRAAPPPPRLPAKLAAGLASESDAVAGFLARNDGCGALAAAQRLQRDTTSAINARRIPARFQEPLAAAANDLVFRIHCAPVVAPQPPPAEDRAKHHGDGNGHGKGKHGHNGGEGE